MSRTRMHGSSEDEDVEARQLLDEPKNVVAPTLSNVLNKIKSQSELNLLPSTSKATTTNHYLLRSSVTKGNIASNRPPKMADSNECFQKQKANKRAAIKGNSPGKVNKKSNLNDTFDPACNSSDSQSANMDFEPVPLSESTISKPTTEPTGNPNLNVTPKLVGETYGSKFNMKPAPLYLYKVTNIITLLSDLSRVIGENNFTTKPAARRAIRVQCNDIVTYNKLTKYVAEKKLDSHTYQLKSERGFRAVIRHLHHSTPDKWIRDHLTKLGHDVKFLRVIKNRYSNQPLNLFEIELKVKDNNADLYKLNSLGNQKIKVEVPLKATDVPQCHRCQKLGHTKNYCNCPYVCVKCGENHATAVCTKQKDDKSPAKCANCLGNHAASYKGCPVYKEALKIKTNAKSSRINNILAGLSDVIPAIYDKRGQPNLRQPRPSSSNPGNPAQSYASALREGLNASQANSTPPANESQLRHSRSTNKKTTLQSFKEPMPPAARPQYQHRSRSLSIRRTPILSAHDLITKNKYDAQLDQITKFINLNNESRLETKLDKLIEITNSLIKIFMTNNSSKLQLHNAKT